MEDDRQLPITEIQINNIRKELELLNEKLSQSYQQDGKKDELNSKFYKKYNFCNNICRIYDLYDNNKYKIHDNEQLLKDEEMANDKESVQLINQEIQSIKKQLQKLKEDFDDLIGNDDDEVINGIVIEIRCGVGGKESALFAGEMLEMYTKFAILNNWKYTIDHIAKTAEGGIREGYISIFDESAYNLLKYESGVHRVQRVPLTEAMGRVHTSTVTIAVLPTIDEISDYVINQKDLRIDVFRSSGAGGQHLNTTDSAVRITHLPTNTVVVQQDERSQHRNKEKAMEVLRTRILQKEIQKQQEEITQQRLEKIGKGNRCEKIRTYNYPQNRITDHRINYSIYNIEGFLCGTELKTMCHYLKKLLKNDKNSILEKYS